MTVVPARVHAETHTIASEEQMSFLRNIVRIRFVPGSEIREALRILVLAGIALSSACGGGDDSVPSVPLTPAPTPSPEPVPTCSVGMVLRPGEGCLFPDLQLSPNIGDWRSFVVTADATAAFCNHPVATDMERVNFDRGFCDERGVAFVSDWSEHRGSFEAIRQADGSWRILTLGEQSFEASRIGRSLVDRPDEVSGWQIHPIYLVARDGVDEELDTNGAIPTILSHTIELMAAQTGRRLRVDTHQGQPDISFARSRRTEQQIRDRGYDIDDVDIGNPENKVYVFFLNTDLLETGRAVAWAHRGGPDGPGAYAVVPLSPWPSTVAHELFHVLGAVPGCAPHEDGSHHVSDERDLMFPDAGWDWIDPGNDDYYGHDIPGCWDTEDSPLWRDPAAASVSSRTRLNSRPPREGSFLCKTQ